MKLINPNRKKQIIGRRNKKNSYEKIKDNEIQSRLDLLRSSGNIKDDKNNKNFPPYNPPDIPPSFPPDFRFYPLSSLSLPNFHSTPPFPSATPFPAIPHFPSFLPPPFAPVTPSTPPLANYDTSSAEENVLADPDRKIRTPQKPIINLMRNVEKIEKAEEKKQSPSHLINYFQKK